MADDDFLQIIDDEDEDEAAAAGTPSASARASASACSATERLCASQRSWASAYCVSHSSRWAS